MRNDCGHRKLYDLIGKLPDLMTVEQEDIIPNDYAGNTGIEPPRVSWRVFYL